MVWSLLFRGAGLAAGLMGVAALAAGRPALTRRALPALWVLLAAALATGPQPLPGRLAAMGTGAVPDPLLWLWALVTAALLATARRGAELPAGIVLLLLLPPLAAAAYPGWPGEVTASPGVPVPAALLLPIFLALGLAGWGVPYAFGLAAMLGARDWSDPVRRWSTAVWVLLGIGVLHGARWSHGVAAGDLWRWAPGSGAVLVPWAAGAVLLAGDPGRRPWLALLPFPAALGATVWTWRGTPAGSAGPVVALLPLAVVTALLPLGLLLSGYPLPRAATWAPGRRITATSAGGALLALGALLAAAALVPAGAQGASNRVEWAGWGQALLLAGGVLRLWPRRGAGPAPGGGG